MEITTNFERMGQISKVVIVGIFPKGNQMETILEYSMLNFGLNVVPTINIQTRYWMILTFVLCCFLTFASAQVQIISLPTLYQLAFQNPVKDPLEQKAIEFMMKTHPELSNYSVLHINSTISRGNQSYADNLKDFLFQLDSPNNSIIALVTMTSSHKQQLITVSPLVTRVPYQNITGVLGDYWVGVNLFSPSQSSITNQTISSDYYQKEKAPQPVPGRGVPGGYTQYKSFDDALLQYAFDYVASQHPNIVNYDIEYAAYQIVAGVNINIKYRGLDKATSINAKLYFDLNSRPFLTSFQVLCSQGSVDCTDEFARTIYNAIEGVILIHPQLIAYRIVGFIADISGGQIKMLVTFSNAERGLRTLTEISVVDNKSTILSYFTYKYQQQ